MTNPKQLDLGSEGGVLTLVQGSKSVNEKRREIHNCEITIRWGEKHVTVQGMTGGEGILDARTFYEIDQRVGSSESLLFDDDEDLWGSPASSEPKKEERERERERGETVISTKPTEEWAAEVAQMNSKSSEKSVKEEKSAGIFVESKAIDDMIMSDNMMGVSLGRGMGSVKPEEASTKEKEEEDDEKEEKEEEKQENDDPGLVFHRSPSDIPSPGGSDELPLRAGASAGFYVVDRSKSTRRGDISRMLS